jgi:hypothetical protein
VLGWNVRRNADDIDKLTEGLDEYRRGGGAAAA